MIKEENPEQALKIAVPGLPGAIGRMKEIATDHGYGIPDSDFMPRVAVGRFPARTRDEMRSMVAKTLRYEKNKNSGIWRHRIVSLIGNPGGSSLIEKRFAEFIVQLHENKIYGEMSPYWNYRIISHSPLSPFFVSGEALEDAFVNYIEEGAFFTIYLGHSGPDLLFSDGTSFMKTEKWNSLRIQQGQGVFFTCGCYACRYEKEEGYGLTAIKNPAGPVAVIGSYDVDYGALGFMAFQGLFAYLNSIPEKARLADYWLSVNRGIAQIEMDKFTFFLFDQADGSGGTVPLDIQRKEHLEMWTLLGDPALNMWTIPRDIRLEVSDEIATGTPVTVSGILPERLAGARVLLTLERSADALCPDKNSLQDRSAQANSYILKSHEIISEGARFDISFKTPDSLPWKSVILRAYAAKQGEEGMGVLKIPVKR